MIAIDSSRPGDVAWTEGNHVEFLAERATYFARLAAVISSLVPDEEVRLTVGRGDSDECGADDEPAIATLVLCRRSPDVRGLPRHSHSGRLAKNANGVARKARSCHEIAFPRLAGSRGQGLALSFVAAMKIGGATRLGNFRRVGLVRCAPWI